MTKPEKLLAALKRGKRLEASQIIKLTGCTNPADVIYKLRRKGYPVEKCMRQNGSRRWAVYYL